MRSPKKPGWSSSGATGPPDLRHESEDFYVGHTLDSALQALLVQARLELNFNARHDPRPAHEIDDIATDAIRKFANALPGLRRLLGPLRRELALEIRLRIVLRLGVSQKTNQHGPLCIRDAATQRNPADVSATVQKWNSRLFKSGLFSQAEST